MEKPTWLRNASSNIEFEEEEEEDEYEDDLVFPIGNIGGWASVANIDWTAPLSEEISSISSLAHDNTAFFKKYIKKEKSNFEAIFKLFST